MTKAVKVKSPKFDPTLNTHDMVKAERRFQNALRDELDQRLTIHADYIHRLKTQEFSMQDAARHAETKRIDEALRLRDEHDREKADMMSKWSDSTAQAVATALASVQRTSAERLDRLEQFMFTQSGKSSGISALWGIVLGAGGLVAALVTVAAVFLHQA